MITVFPLMITALPLLALALVFAVGIIKLFFTGGNANITIKEHMRSQRIERALIKAQEKADKQQAKADYIASRTYIRPTASVWDKL